MKTPVLLAALAALLLAAGCAGPGRYPLSRSLAGPNDPVHGFSVPQAPVAP